ncbi:MAG: Vps62-related protein [Magnetococcus sp. DMHC-1]
MDQAAWQNLADTFAPKVYLHSEDNYRPSSVDWYLAKSDLYQVDSDDTATMVVQNPSQADLLTYNSASNYLKLENEDDRSGDINNLQWYAHIRKSNSPASDTWLDIQYWFFYPYNGDVKFTTDFCTLDPNKTGHHEGDWEHITVRLSNWTGSAADAVVEAVYFARHSDESVWRVVQASTPTRGYFALDGTHPIVFSAKNSHASYEASGSYERLTGSLAKVADLKDYCDEDGPCIDPTSSSYTNLVEIVAIDSDLLGDETDITFPDFISWLGKWGSTSYSQPIKCLGITVYTEKASSPSTPSTKDNWADDGDSGYNDILVTWDEFGDGWGSDRSTSALAVGDYQTDQSYVMIAAGRDAGSGKRVLLYSLTSNNTFTEFANAGNGWGNDRGTTALAFGVLYNSGSTTGIRCLAVGRNSGSNERVFLYNYTLGGNLDNTTLLDSVGSNWSKSSGTTGLAFGTIDNNIVLGITRTSSSGSRILFYTWSSTNAKLESLCELESSWGSSRNPTCIDMTQWDFDPTKEESIPVTLAAVGRNSGDNDRFFVYQYSSSSNTFATLAKGGSGWGSDRSCTAIAFGVLDGQQVLGVGRNGSDNDRFFLYAIASDGTLTELAKGGSNWGSSHGCSSICFSAVNGQDVLIVGRSGGGNSAIEAYTYDSDTNSLTSYASEGSSWGDSRYVTTMATGMVDDEPILVVGRNDGSDARGIVYGWNT